MKREIWFDMDGTLADFYNVEGWLDSLIAHSVHPYSVARPLVDMRKLNKTLNRLQRDGWTINIISWGSKDRDPDYLIKIDRAKRGWIRRHMGSVHFDRIEVVPYGTPKGNGRGGILFDDEKPNRDGWHDGIAFDVDNIITILESLG